MPISKDLEKNNAICILPWIAIHQKNDKVNSCCIQRTYPETNEVKKHMLAGMRHESCATCYSIEDRGLASQRQKMTLEWTERLGIDSIEDFDGINGIKSIDSRLDNTCNAMCRSCHPGASNLISTEYFKLNLIDKIEDHYSAPIDLKYLSTAERLYFAGGEPLINKDFTKTLNTIIDIERTNVELLVNTNASVIDSTILEKLKKFTNLTAIVSLDGIDEVQTYIRWPIQWHKFEKNVSVLSDISKTLVFNTVISIYNITRLYSIINWVENNYPSAVLYFSILERPEILKLEHHPNTTAVLKELEKIKTLQIYKTNDTVYSTVNSLIDSFSKKPRHVNTETLSKFFSFNDLLDSSRNVKLIDYIPELEECRKYINE